MFSGPSLSGKTCLLFHEGPYDQSFAIPDIYSILIRFIEDIYLEYLFQDLRNMPFNESSSHLLVVQALDSTNIN